MFLQCFAFCEWVNNRCTTGLVSDIVLPNDNIDPFAVNAGFRVADGNALPGISLHDAIKAGIHRCRLVPIRNYGCGYTSIGSSAEVAGHGYGAWVPNQRGRKRAAEPTCPSGKMTNRRKPGTEHSITMRSWHGHRRQGMTPQQHRQWALALSVPRSFACSGFAPPHGHVFQSPTIRWKRMDRDNNQVRQVHCFME